MLFPLSRLRWDMDRLFDRFLDSPGYEGSGFADVRLDVSESEDQIVVRAEVAGIDPKELDIQLVGDVLTLSGEKSEERENGGKNAPHYSERRFGAFRRSIQLGTPVDPDSVTAAHKNGVVTITMQKAESARPKRIQIKAD
jgi:HSP20 family protein